MLSIRQTLKANLPNQPYLVESHWEIRRELVEKTYDHTDSISSVYVRWEDAEEGIPEFLRQFYPPEGVRPEDFWVRFDEDVLILTCSSILIHPRSRLAEEHLEEILQSTEAARFPFVDAEQIKLRAEARDYLLLAPEQQAELEGSLKSNKEWARYHRMRDLALEEELTQALGDDMGPSLKDLVGDPDEIVEELKNLEDENFRTLHWLFDKPQDAEVYTVARLNPDRLKR